ncbi:hypothetical protein [Clostridium sp. C2-6-12]|uniref:hypothetical protein n=1 Tax=Clostridium sp. C2-6-12 TaxID=2698832 RepID=UPI001FABF6C9|nr:hypothetical protein [Clostridium sp. C2-6-12]
MDNIDNYIKFNEKAWDNFSDANYQWTIPVSSETIELAQKGTWDVVITPTKAYTCCIGCRGYSI